jgi:hypothetical protein
MIQRKMPVVPLLILAVPSVLIGSCVRGHCGEIRHATYTITGAKEDDSCVATRVDLFVGRSDDEEGALWEMVVTLEDGRDLAVRAESDRGPMTHPEGPGDFTHYAFRTPEGPAFEYVNERTGQAQLPRFDFVSQFLPAPAWGTVYVDGFAASGSFLGHQATLESVTVEEEPAPWEDVKVLRLRPDLLIGTANPFRDDGTGPNKAGEYRFVDFTEEDYEEMISAGINYFGPPTAQLPWVRDRAVFWRHAPTFPDDFYRSNYIGMHMCADEPMIRLGFQGVLSDRLVHPHQLVSHLMTRVAAIYGRRGYPWAVEEAVRRTGFHLGTLRLFQDELPAWEGIYEAAFYELAAGAPSIVHEGRYGNPDGHGWHPSASLGSGLELAAEETLRCHYGFLRGAARAWDGDWGMSIYGHSEPDIRTQAVTLAYDMGAKYVWFWTGGVGYHIPYAEQLALTRAVMERARTSPRGDLEEIRDAPRTAIAYPMGYTLSWGRMWWGIEAFDNERRNPAGALYREVAATGLFQGILCAKQGIDFDFTTDHEGLDRLGYDRILRVREDASVDVWPRETITNPPRLAVAGHWEASRDATLPRDSTQTVRAACLYGRSPEVDGRLLEWPRTEVLSLEPDAEGAKSWDGPADLSADIVFGYDQECLYIGATVRDDVWRQRHDAWAIWNGDCLQIAFDPLSLRDPSGYGENNHEIGFTLVDGRPVCVRWHGRRGQVREEVASVRLAIRRDENAGMTIYEAAIPFAELAPLCPQIVPTTGFAAVVNDADDNDRESYAETDPGVMTAGKHPDRFHTLRFNAPPPSTDVSGAWATLLWNETVMPEGGAINVDVYSVSRNAAEGRIELEITPTGPTPGLPGRRRLPFPASNMPLIRDLRVTPEVPPGQYRLRVRALSSAGKVIMDENAPLYVYPH